MTGLKVIDGLLGRKHVETVTVEAKIGSGNWRYYFFEAVAHKRFAHRAYFAFGCGTDEPNVTKVQDFHMMREYAEKYGIGIVVLFMPKATYAQLIGEGVAALELGIEAVRVEEI